MGGGGGGLQGTATLSIRTAASSPVARIRGGDRLQALGGDGGGAIIVDGSDSWHPDYAPSAQAAAQLAFAWTCRQLLISEESRPCPGAPPASTQRVSVPLGGISAAAVNATRYLLIGLTVTGAGGGASNDTVRVYLSAAAAPVVSVLAPKQRYSVQERLVLSSSVELSAGGTAAGGLSYSWSTVSGDVDISLVQNLVSLNPNAPWISIKPNTLTGGTAYTFRLTVTAAGTAAAGWAQASISLNAPPCQGQPFYVVPLQGVALESAFSMSFNGWQDPEGDLPLSYQVALPPSLNHLPLSYQVAPPPSPNHTPVLTHTVRVPLPLVRLSHTR